MKADLVEVLRCPRCASTLELDAQCRVGDEIDQGVLTCRGCHHQWPIANRIPRLVEALDEDTKAEVVARADLRVTAEWLAFVREFGDHAERWTSKVVRGDGVPELPARFEADTFGIAELGAALTQVDVAGKRVLDVAPGNCWSTRVLARRGADCLAVDLVPTFLEVGAAHLGDGIFFERLAANMNRLPVRDGVFDLAFSVAAIHHSSDLTATLREMWRVLGPGGRLVLLAEPVAGLLRSYGADLASHRERGLNEHVYPLWAYVRAAGKAGFAVRTLFPESFRLQLRGVLPHPPSWRLTLVRSLPESVVEALLPLQQMVIGVGLSAILTKSSTD